MTLGALLLVGTVFSAADAAPAVAPAVAPAGPGPAAMKLHVASAATAAKFGAACLDGSAPSMYVRTNPASTKWVLFLEGGGWCFGATPDSTLASCASRAKGPPGAPAPPGGSSATNPPTAPDYGGILGGGAMENPGFSSWNMVFMKYCDGSSFGGGRAAPATSKDGRKISFRNLKFTSGLTQNLGQL